MEADQEAAAKLDDVEITEADMEDITGSATEIAHASEGKGAHTVLAPFSFGS